jgi:hypothetical protein
MGYRDYGPAWPWAWDSNLTDTTITPAGVIVEHWWTHGEVGESRLDTRLLARVLRDPEFKPLHPHEAPAFWPPRGAAVASLAIEPRRALRAVS